MEYKAGSTKIAREVCVCICKILDFDSIIDSPNVLGLDILNDLDVLHICYVCNILCL